MSAPMKKPRTETIVIGGERLQVSNKTAQAVLVLLKSQPREHDAMILSNDSEVLNKLDSNYTRPGSCLYGARIKEDMSQVELADRIGISQSNLSKMELGKRPIGRQMAKRIAKILKVDYRILL